MTGPRLLALLVVLLGGWLGLFELYDYDVGLARATGEWIVEHGAVPHLNVMSTLHADHPFVDDKWLFHVLAHGVIDGFGWTAAVVLRMLLLAGLAFLLLPAREVRARAPGVAALVAVVALVAMSERFAFRPELFTMLFLAAFGRLLMRAEPPAGREVVLLVALQIAWTNLHGYWVLGPIVAAATGVGAAFDALSRRAAIPWPRLALPFLLLGAAFVNPYGLALVRSPVDILADLEQNLGVYQETIVEFVPTFADHAVLPYDLVAYRALLGAGVVGLLLARRRVRLVELLPVLAFFVMSLKLRRNIAPFAVVAAPIVARWLVDGLPDAWRSLAGRGAVAGVVPLAALIGFGHFTDAMPIHDRLDKRFGWGRAGDVLPLDEIRFIRSHAPPGTVFVSFTWGSTFTGEAFPEQTPFIDGNTAGYDAATLQRYADAVRGRLDPERLHVEDGVSWFLLKPGHALVATLLADPRWVPLRLGTRAIVIARRDTLPERLVADDLREADGRLGSGGETTPSTFDRRTFPWAELNRARVLSWLERFEEAEAECLAATEVAPELFEPWHELGVARLAAGRRRFAVEAFDRALELASGAILVLSDRALALWQMKRYDEAERDLAAAIARRPDDAILWFRRALVAKDDNRVRDARVYVARALDCDPELEPAQALRERIGGG